MIVDTFRSNESVTVASKYSAGMVECKSDVIFIVGRKSNAIEYVPALAVVNSER